MRFLCSCWSLNALLSHCKWLLSGHLWSLVTTFQFSRFVKREKEACCKPSICSWFNSWRTVEPRIKVFSPSAENCIYRLWAIGSFYRRYGYTFWAVHCLQSVVEALAVVFVGALLQIIFFHPPPVIVDSPQVCLSCFAKVSKMIPLVVWLWIS